MSALIDISKNVALNAWNGAKAHAPLICTIGATVGVISTAAFAVLDTKNYLSAKEDEEMKLGRELTNAEKLKIGAPEYIRTAVSGASTIALAWGTYGLQSKVITGLNSSLLLASKQLDMTRAAFKDYRDETQKYLPSNPEELKKMEKIIGGRKNDTPTEEMTKPGNVLMTNNDQVLHFKEVDTGIQYFKTYAEFENARNKINADINEQGFGSLNAFHDYMGVDECEIGWDIGWMQIIDCDLDARMIFDDHKKPEIVIFVAFSKSPELKW